VPQSNHHDKSQQLTQNQNNKMSEDPGDGSRNSDRIGDAGQGEPVEIAPEEKAQHDEETLEAFGEKGAGIAAKE
jgi:hypothetical protein